MTSPTGIIDTDTQKLGFTPEMIAAASAETERLSRELDITNADHIALWLETNARLGRAYISWLALRIAEAHEAHITALEARLSDADARVREERERCAALVEADAASCVPIMNGVGHGPISERNRHRAMTELATAIRNEGRPKL